MFKENKTRTLADITISDKVRSNYSNKKGKLQENEFNQLVKAICLLMVFAHEYVLLS